MGLQRRGRAEVATLLTGLGQAYTAGVAVDWPVLFTGSGARKVELPTYAFQRRSYWLEGEPVTGDVSSAGLDERASTRCWGPRSPRRSRTGWC